MKSKDIQASSCKRSFKFLRNINDVIFSYDINKQGSVFLVHDRNDGFITDPAL